jgi:cytochrome c peroxidase
MATRGKRLFMTKAGCATCHVPPLFTEPGFNLHPGSDIGISNFQANRSPTHMYRTAPLHGLWTHSTGGFYHDGRFKSLMAVVNHYNTFQNLKLTPRERKDLVQYLKSL